MEYLCIEMLQLYIFGEELLLQAIQDLDEDLEFLCVG